MIFECIHGIPNMTHSYHHGFTFLYNCVLCHKAREDALCRIDPARRRQPPPIRENQPEPAKRRRVAPTRRTNGPRPQDVGKKAAFRAELMRRLKQEGLA